MPKGRMLNKKVSKDLAVAKLSCKSALLYTWCIPHLDVEGRIEASPDIIKGVVVPYRKDFSLSVIQKCIEEIAQTDDLISYYGKEHKYMQFNGFQSNQTLNKEREAPSEIPAPTPDLLLINSGLNLSKVKLNIREGANAHLSDKEFLETLKTNPVYKGIDIDREFGKMDTWLLANPGRQKTRRFIVNWLNKIDKPLGVLKTEKKQQPSKTCTVCNGTGKIAEGDRAGAPCWCLH